MHRSLSDFHHYALTIMRRCFTTLYFALSSHQSRYHWQFGVLRWLYIKEYTSTLMLRWKTLHTFVRLQHFLFVCKISLCRHEVQTDVIHLMDDYLCCCSVSAHCGWVGLLKCCKGIHSVLICSHEGWSDTMWFLRPKGRLLWVPSGLNAAHLSWGGIYYDGRKKCKNRGVDSQ